MIKKQHYFVGLLLLLAIVWASSTSTAWAMSLESPLRQTVPLTPPATWTPIAPTTSPTSAPTTAPRPTAVPQPTDAPVEEGYAQPWVTLEDTFFEIAPGDLVELNIMVENVGTAFSDLNPVTVNANGLAIVEASGEMVFNTVVAALDPGEADSLQVTIQVPDDLWPGDSFTVTVMASMDDIFDAQEVTLDAPRAILPATGK